VVLAWIARGDAEPTKEKWIALQMPHSTKIVEVPMDGLKTALIGGWKLLRIEPALPTTQNCPDSQPIEEWFQGVTIVPSVTSFWPKGSKSEK